jgi:hypothetical protein
MPSALLRLSRPCAIALRDVSLDIRRFAQKPSLLNTTERMRRDKANRSYKFAQYQAQASKPDASAILPPV